MIEDIIVEPMTEKFILWRCLHGGPLSPDDIDQCQDDTDFPWARYPHPDLQDHDEFVKTLEQQAKEIGIASEKAENRKL